MSRLRLGIGGTRLCDGIEAAHGEAAAEKSESASGDSRSKAAATSASEGLRRSQQAIGQMRGLSGTIAQSLNSIGNLLGGTAGAPFRNMAADIRRKQAFVRQAEATPRQAVARAEQAPRRALSGTRSVQRQLSGGRLSTGATAEPADSSAKEMAADAQVGTPKLVGREAGGTTPFIDAGGALAVDLDVMPVKRPRETAELKIVVRSKGLEGVGAPWLIEEMTVVVNRVGWFDHSWPVLVYGVAILLQLLLAWALLSTGIVG